MEALKELQKTRRKSQREFLRKPFAPNAILFDGYNLQKLPKFGNESVLNFIY
jgi:hypothetical protein